MKKLTLRQYLPEPVLDGRGVCLVFLSQQEPHELRVGHPRLPIRGQSVLVASRHAAGEHALDHAA